MITLSKKTKNEIKCIAGTCNHSVLDSTCLFNKLADARDIYSAYEKIIKRIVERELKEAETKVKKKAPSKRKVKRESSRKQKS